jgi:hypothetical protein
MHDSVDVEIELLLLHLLELLPDYAAEDFWIVVDASQFELAFEGVYN